MSSMNNMMILGSFFCSWSCSTALWQSEVMAPGWTVSDPPEIPRPPLLTHLVAHLPLNYPHSSWISAGSVLLTHRVHHHLLHEVRITGSGSFFFWFAVPSILPFSIFIFSSLSPCVRNQCTVWKRKKRELSVNDWTTNEDWSFLDFVLL